MRKLTYNEMMNEKRKSKARKKQINIIAEAGGKMGIPRKRKRAEAETALLVRAVVQDIKRLEAKGVLVRNGRNWRFNCQS